MFADIGVPLNQYGATLRCDIVIQHKWNMDPNMELK